MDSGAEGETPIFWKGIRTRLRERRTAPRILPRGQPGPAPLSGQQEWLWYLDQIRPGRSAQHLNQVIRFRGRLDASALTRALKEIASRHDILRTSISVVRGQPRQEVAERIDMPVSLDDVSGLPEDAREASVGKVFRSVMSRPFDLTRSPLWRCRLIRLAGEEYQLVRSAHHMVFDAWSGSVFQRELAALYDTNVSGRPSPLPPLDIQYADYAEWQRAKHSEDTAASCAYWKRVFGDTPQALSLPVDRAHRKRPDPAGSWSTLELPAELVQALGEFSRRSGTSLNTTLLAAFQVLLHAHSGQDDLIICSPVSGRSSDTRDLIGYFNNVLALRLSLTQDIGAEELLARTGRTLSSAQAHDDFQFHRLGEIPALASVPLNRAMFAFQNVPDRPGMMSGLDVHTENTGSETADYDLYLSIRRIRPSLYANLQYRTELFDRDTIDSLLRGYALILENLPRRPTATVRDLCRLVA